MKRLTLLGCAAAATVGSALAGLVGRQDEPVVAARGQTALAVLKQPKESMARPIRRSLGPVSQDPFFSAPKPAPPPPPPPVAAAPAPQFSIAPAPTRPFPFRVVGAMTGLSGGPAAFLSDGERLLTVSGNGDLGNGYWVDELSDERLVVIDVASQQRNVFEFGAALEPDAWVRSPVEPQKMAVLMANPPQPQVTHTTIEVALAAPPDESIGETFDVPVRVKSELSLRGLPIGVAYDRTRLELIDFSEGPFFKSGGVTTSVSRTGDSAAGSIDFGILRNTPDGTSGEGLLATLRFKAIASGAAQVRIARMNPLGIDRIVEAPKLPPPVSVSIK
jgi:hypothetical protein